MNELLTPDQVMALKAENDRLRAALAELEKQLAWVVKELRELAQ